MLWSIWTLVCLLLQQMKAISRGSSLTNNSIYNTTSHFSYTDYPSVVPPPHLCSESKHVSTRPRKVHDRLPTLWAQFFNAWFIGLYLCWSSLPQSLGVSRLWGIAIILLAGLNSPAPTAICSTNSRLWQETTMMPLILAPLCQQPRSLEEHRAPTSLTSSIHRP